MTNKIAMTLLTIVGLAVVSLYIVAPFFGWQFSMISALAMGAALLMLGAGIFGLGQSVNPIKSKWVNLGLGIFLFAVAIGTVYVDGVSGTGGPALSTSAATIAGSVGTSQVTGSTSDTGVSLTDCQAKVDKTLLGQSATINVEGYDLAADDPDTAKDLYVNVYKSNTVAQGTRDNFLKTMTDTTTATVTNVKVGDVVSFAGGNATGYVKQKDGVCVDGQQINVRLDGYSVATEANLLTTIYDSTGSAAVTAGNGGIDYNDTLSASQEKTYYWKIEQNGANKAFDLGALAFAKFTNITEASPSGDSAGLFTKVATPQFAESITIDSNSTAAGADIIRSYTVYKLNSHVLLEEFKSKTYQFSVKASSNDPLGAENTAGMAGIAGVVLDVVDQKSASTGAIVPNSLHDQTSSEANVGLSETLTNPAGKTSGFVMLIG